MSPAETAIEDPASAEQNLRIDMAAGFRWIEKTGMSDLTAGSLVTRLPGETEWMFTHPLGHYFDEICASDFFKVNYEGEAIDGSNHRVAFAATNPAAHLFRARPDVNATIHAHAPAVMAVSGLECGLLFASEPSFMFYKEFRTWIRISTSTMTTAGRWPTRRGTAKPSSIEIILLRWSDATSKKPYFARTSSIKPARFSSG